MAMTEEGIAVRLSLLGQSTLVSGLRDAQKQMASTGKAGADANKAMADSAARATAATNDLAKASANATKAEADLARAQNDAAAAASTVADRQAALAAAQGEAAGSASEAADRQVALARSQVDAAAASEEAASRQLSLAAATAEASAANLESARTAKLSADAEAGLSDVAGRASKATSDLAKASAAAAKAEADLAKAQADAAGSTSAVTDRRLTQAAATRDVAAANLDAAATAKTEADAEVAASARSVEAADARKASWEGVAAFGKTAFLGVAGAAAVIGVESVKAASTFQASMERIHTQAGMPQARIADLSKAILGLAPQVATGPNALADALYRIASANAGLGATNAQLIAMTKAAAELAKIGGPGTNLEETSRIIGGVKASGVIGGGDPQQVVALANAVVGSGDMKMADFVNFLGTGVLPAAKEFGVNLASMGSSMALLGDNLYSGQVAGHSMTHALALMGAPSGAAQKAYGSIGLAPTQLGYDLRQGGLSQAIGDLVKHLGAPTGSMGNQKTQDKQLSKFGFSGQQIAGMNKAGPDQTEQALILTRAFGGAKQAGPIVTLIEEYDRYLAKSKEVAGAQANFADSWKKTTQTFGFTIDKLKASIQTIAIRIGNVLMPIITAFFGFLAHHQAAIVALAAVIGGVLIAAIGVWIVEMATATVTIGTFEMAAAPLILIVAAVIVGIAALGLGIYELVKHWHAVTRAIGNFADAVVHFITTHKALAIAIAVAFPPLAILVGIVVGVIEAIKHWGAITAWLAQAWHVAWTDVKAVATSVWDWLKGAAKSTTDWLGGAWQSVEAVARSVWQVITTVITAAWHVIDAVIRTIWIPLQILLTTGYVLVRIAAQVAFNLMRDIITAAWHVIDAVTRAVWGALSPYLNAVWNLLRTVATIVYNAITADITAGWHVIDAVTRAVWGALGPWLVGAWHDLYASCTQVWTAIDGVFNTVWSAISSTVHAAWTEISDWLSGSWKQFYGFAAGIWNEIVTTVASAWNALPAVARSVWAAITGFFAQGYNDVAKIINGFISAINSVSSALHIGTTINALPTVNVGGPAPAAAASGGGAGPGGTRAASGGTIGGGFMTKGPQVVVGEGRSAYPEFVVPTDPAHRDNALALYGRLGGALMANGGVLGAIGSAASSAASTVGGAASSVVGAAGSALGAVASAGLGALLAPAELIAQTALAAAPPGYMHDMVTAFLNMLIGWAGSQGASGGGGGGAGGGAPPSGGAAYTGGGSLQQWIDTALQLMGMPLTFGAGIAALIGHESGGNPNAQNNTDCVSLATLILTHRGWLRHDQVRVGDQTIGYNPVTGCAEWTRISRVVHYDNAEVWRIGHRNWHADVTPNHRWWSDTGFVQTRDLAPGQSIRIGAPSSSDVVAALGAPVDFAAEASVIPTAPEVVEPQTVYCLTTDLGTWTARLDDRAFITGNSNAARGTPSKGLMQCTTLRTRILTRRGFLSHDEVRIGDETIGYNPATGRSEWTPITKIVHYDDAPVWRIGHRNWHADVTPNHRWWSDTEVHTSRRSGLTCCPECDWQPGTGRNPRFGPIGDTDRSIQAHRAKMHDVGPNVTTTAYRGEFVRTEDFKPGHRIRLAAPADTDGVPSLSLEDAAIIAWLQGDGHIRRTETGNGHDGVIFQSKPAMIVKLRALLARVPHTEAHRDRGGNTLTSHSFHLRRAYVTDLLKRAPDAVDDPERFVAALSPDQRAAWLGAMIDAEGHRMPGRKPGWSTYVRIVQINGPLSDAIRLAVYLEGWRPTFSANSAERRGYKPCGAIGMAKPHVAPSTFLPHQELEHQTVYCVQTPLQTWTAELDGQVFLTGNTIQGTFDQYVLPSEAAAGIFDPVANITAGVRYALANYGPGMLMAGGRHTASGAYLGYASGGILSFDQGGMWPPGTLGFNGTSEAETVIPPGAGKTGTSIVIENMSITGVAGTPKALAAAVKQGLSDVLART